MRVPVPSSSGDRWPCAQRDAACDLAGPDWARLTEVGGKKEVFAGDLFALEGWAALVAGLGEDGAYAFAQRTALMYVRPDALAAGTTRQILAAAAAADFAPLAVMPVRLERCAVRSLWAYTCRWATAERLVLLDAVAALGPGLLVLWADARGGPACARMTGVKGRNDPRRRAGGTLRDAGGSPNRALTLVHTPDEPADVVRELGVLCSWPERAALIGEASARRAGAGVGLEVLEAAVGAVERELPALGWPTGPRGPVRTPAVRELHAGPVAQRWAAVVAASASWPLLRRTPGPATWPEQETRSPWR
ncbi:hypothetical protein ACFU99_34065 [Streptomyces sp. NPDC057654]|uniref:hypothetical protein n=1 Tax=Streptomyces sp. NPDC057654 TaxID=3346196 RepID=UPI0036989E01